MKIILFDSNLNIIPYFTGTIAYIALNRNIQEAKNPSNSIDELRGMKTTRDSK